MPEVSRELSAQDIQKIAGTYHEWRKPKGNYEDIKGFCNSASIERVRELDFVLTPGRYVGLPDEDKNGNIRDYADVSQLVCLANQENLNAHLIEQGVPQNERLLQLNKTAILQMKILTADLGVKRLEGKDE